MSENINNWCGKYDFGEKIEGEKYNTKSILLIATLFSSFLLTTPMVQAGQGIAPEEPVGFKITDFAVYDTTMSQEELYAFPGYVEVLYETGQEPEVPAVQQDLVEPLTWISFPYPSTVDVMIVVDDDMKAHWEAMVGYTVAWSVIYEWANDILEGGDDPFWSSFEIDFVTRQYRQWNSPSDTLLNLLTLGEQAFPKPEGIDVTVIVTGQIEGGISPYAGWSQTLGDAFIMTTRAAGYLMPLGNLWQHEASHLYGAHDHSDWWSALTTWCIMSYMWSPVTRSWCSGCSSTIYNNRLRFGYYYKSVWIY